jgi:hypothetical protein
VRRLRDLHFLIDFFRFLLPPTETGVQLFK